MLAMIAVKKELFTPEEMAKLEIRNFVFEGLKDVEKGNLYDFDETFDELEKRYQNEEV